MFEYRTTIKLPHTDAAGIMFFANYFNLAHDVYEAFLESIGFPMRDMIDNRDYLLVIVHAEADYKNSYRLGEGITVKMHVEKIGISSVVFRYDFYDEKQQNTGTAQTVHSCIDKKNNKKRDLPEFLRSAFNKQISA